MYIHDLFRQQSTSLSFEFFPPKTEASKQIFSQHAQELAQLRPSFVSVTYGAGGSTRSQAEAIAYHFHSILKLYTIPHLTCIGHSQSKLYEILDRFYQKGIRSIMALRGDPPKHSNHSSIPHHSLHYAKELVQLIKDYGQFTIGVAGYPEGHPETPNRLDELDYLKQKVDSGADFVVTQLFFDNHDFYDFYERCELVGIQVPILAGIMPILSIQGIKRMAGLCGARIPADLLRKLANVSNDEDVRKIGTEWTIAQCQDLIASSVKGLHFYTLNQVSPIREICAAIGFHC